MRCHNEPRRFALTGATVAADAPEPASASAFALSSRQFFAFAFSPADDAVIVLAAAVADTSAPAAGAVVVVVVVIVAVVVVVVAAVAVVAVVAAVVVVVEADLRRAARAFTLLRAASLMRPILPFNSPARSRAAAAALLPAPGSASFASFNDIFSAAVTSLAKISACRDGLGKK
jgi:hypothetical protein